jgi:hypothetical protein
MHKGEFQLDLKQRLDSLWWNRPSNIPRTFWHHLLKKSQGRLDWEYWKALETT